MEWHNYTGIWSCTNSIGIKSNSLRENKRENKRRLADPSMELERADEEVLLEKQQFAGGGRRGERKDHAFAVAFTANLGVVAAIAVRLQNR